MSSLASTENISHIGTIKDLFYDPSTADEESKKDLARVTATGRRSWKTLKGKREVVWPPIVYVYKKYCTSRLAS